MFHLQFQYYWVEAMYWLHKLNVDLSMFSEQYFKSNIWHELNIIIAWPCCLLTLLTKSVESKLLHFLQSQISVEASAQCHQILEP